MNQCDGCMRKLRLNKHGHHIESDGGVFACTKDRYEPQDYDMEYESERDRDFGLDGWGNP